MLGQHVNLAARLMQAAGDDGVLTDATTYQEARRDRTFERLPAHVLKGMAAPIDVYRLRGGDSAVARPAQLVDRIVEQAAASAAIEAVKAGVGDLIVLEGEPGIGKTIDR